MSAWLLVGIAFAVLLVLWKILELTLDCIALWHAGRRRDDVQPATERAGEPPIGARASS